MKTRLIKVGRFTYRVRCEPDFDGGNAIFVNGNLLADLEHYPSDEELVTIIADNIKLEKAIKSSFVAQGVFE